MKINKYIDGILDFPDDNHDKQKRTNKTKTEREETKINQNANFR